MPRDYGDDDAHWDPAGYGDDDEDTLGWDASADPKAFNPVFRDSVPATTGTMVRNDTGDTGSDELAPTQRLSQVSEHSNFLYTRQVLTKNADSGVMVMWAGSGIYQSGKIMTRRQMEVTGIMVMQN